MKEDGEMRYRRFLAMIATSTAVMFGLMYLNTYALDHILFSQTRFWMAMVMGATMAIVMLSFMLGMYRDAKKNALIYAGAIVVFSVGLWLVRSQQTIGDVAYLRAMIPHHSIAIMTSERARIRDSRTRALADEIIEAQRREIAEMKDLIQQIEQHGIRSAPEAEASP
jgi:ABC-type lipoprotein release transport system permease subunit